MELVPLSEPVGAKPVELAQSIINQLYQTYQNDPQVFAKMHNFICFRLPNIIQDIHKTDQERKLRNEILSYEQCTFIQTFLCNNKYFYCSQTERYFQYDGVHYYQKKEDEILHNILTTITNDFHHLMPRKPQTKVYIMKRIKETSPLKSIPESATIQFVLGLLCPSFFQTKHDAKYFLTIVGDHLLKKADDTTHSYFASTKAKDFLRELSVASHSVFGVNAAGLFKHKYHGHSYSSIRLLKMNDTIGIKSIWLPVLQTYILDILCVAAHYSDRYGSADQFLNDDESVGQLANYALYFQNKTPRDVVCRFIQKCILFPETTDEQLAQPPMPFATMEYLWTAYLKDSHFPCVLCPASFAELVQVELAAYYDADQRCFHGLSSPYLEMIMRFQRFWQECIVDSPDDEMGEYEIDELVLLYREWNCVRPALTRISCTQMCDLIRTYYPGVQVVNDKYVKGIQCRTWNKVEELNSFFLKLHNDICRDITLSANTPECISIYDAYAKYSEYCKTRENGKPRGQMISKTYFDMYVRSRLSYMVDEQNIYFL